MQSHDLIVQVAHLRHLQEATGNNNNNNNKSVTPAGFVCTERVASCLVELPEQRQPLAPRSPARPSASSLRLFISTKHEAELSDIKTFTHVNAGISQSEQTLTDAVVHLIAVFLQVVLDAALEEVQFGLELLGEAEHAVFTPGQVGVVAQEAQPGGGTFSFYVLFQTLFFKTCFNFTVYSVFTS